MDGLPPLSYNACAVYFMAFAHFERLFTAGLLLFYNVFVVASSRDGPNYKIKKLASGLQCIKIKNYCS